MAETTTDLSDTFTSDEFSKKLSSWNFAVAGNAALEKAFAQKANKRIKKAHSGDSDNDIMTREVITSSLFDAKSAEDFRNSYGGWVNLGLDDEIDERNARAEDFKERYEALLAELTEGVTDQFERYGIERHVPYSAPRKVTDTLGFIASAKANLISIDEFVRENEGEVFQQVGMFAFTAGVFTEGGITIERRDKAHRLIFPTVPNSVYSGWYDTRHSSMRIIDLSDKNLSSDASAYEDGLLVRSVQEFLRSDTFWASKISHTPAFSIGEIPHGPFFYTDSPENPYYQANLEFYESHLATMRLLTQLATKPELRSSVEFLQ
jgi:hypothetical protein